MADLRHFARAIQANFDHLMGTIRNIGDAHNLVVEDIDEIVTSHLLGGKPVERLIIVPRI
jgi:hypothetical protein